MSSPTEQSPVVLTRAPEDNAGLARLLVQAGLPVLEWPAMATEDVVPDGGPAEIRDRLDRADGVVFTSRRGVDALCRLVGPGPVARALATRPAAAVGPATAERLAELGVTCSLTGSGRGAEDLVAALVTRFPAGSRVLIVRSLAAEDRLPELLAAAGLDVSVAALHRPVAPEPVRREPRRLAAVVAASPSAARQVVTWNPWLRRVPFVAIGATTERALREDLGVVRVSVAAAPTDEALCAAVRALLGADVTERREPEVPR